MLLFYTIGNIYLCYELIYQSNWSTLVYLDVPFPCCMYVVCSRRVALPVAFCLSMEMRCKMGPSNAVSR